MAMPNGQSGFWEGLIRHLAEVGKNESWLARRLDVPAQTLSSWKQRNQFRRSCLRTLSDLVRWEGLSEDVAVELGVELIEGKGTGRAKSHPTEEVLRRVNREYRVAEKTFRRYAGHTLRVLHSLGENSFVAFSACTNSPYEVENTPEGRAIALALAHALCNGALLLYIRPSEEGVSYYRDTWGYGQLVYEADAIKELAAFRDQLKGWMVRGDVEGHPRMTGAEADLILHERLGQCHVARSPMWLPGVSLSMIGWTHDRELKTRMTISLPGARFGGQLIYPHYSTLEFRFGRFLRSIVLEACKEVQARKEGRTGGQVQLVLPEEQATDAGLRSLERFYVRYSQILRSVYSIESTYDAIDQVSR